MRWLEDFIDFWKRKACSFQGFKAQKIQGLELLWPSSDHKKRTYLRIKSTGNQIKQHTEKVANPTVFFTYVSQ